MESLSFLMTNIPLPVGYLLLGQILTGILLSFKLAVQDRRSCHLDLTVLTLWILLGINFAWATTLLNPSNNILSAVSSYSHVLSDLVLKSLLGLLPLFLIRLVLRGGIGGGDIRYLVGLVFWLPLDEYFRTLLIACCLSAVIQLAVRRSPSDLKRYRAAAFIPIINLVMIGRLIVLLVEWRTMF